jgi:glycosyltransferase involved in cell wall biosynthesis
MTVNVYLVTPGGTSGRGGIGRVVGYLEQGWRERQDDIVLHVVDSYGPNRRALMPFAFALTTLRLAVAGVLGRIDLLHLNVAERGSFWRKAALLWLGKLLGIPVVLHCHGAELVQWAAGLPPAAHRFVMATFARADRVLVLGSYWREFAVRELGLAPERVETLWNAVPAPPARRRREPGAARLLFLGRLGPRKGVPELLAALRHANVALLRWSAVLAGDGAVGQYRAEITAAGLQDRIELPGWIDAGMAQDYLANADILVLPSHNEGLPIAILEAMAAGLAIVTTPVGAVPDAIRDGQTGLLVPPGDVDALAAALRRLITDPPLRSQLGRRARERFQADFSIRAHIERLAAIYRDVTASAAQGRLRSA